MAHLSHGWGRQNHRRGGVRRTGGRAQTLQQRQARFVPLDAIFHLPEGKKKKRAELENGGGSTSLCMTRCYSLELPLFVCCDQSVFASVHVCPAHIPPEYEYHPAAGQSSRLRRQLQLQHGGLISSTESSVFDQCSIISHRIDHLSHLICFHPRLTLWGYYLPIMLVNVVRLLWALTHDILNNWSKCCAKQTPKAISHLLQLNHTICSYFHAFLQSTCDLLTCMLPRNEHVFIKILHCHTNNSENINDYHIENSVPWSSNN